MGLVTGPAVAAPTVPAQGGSRDDFSAAWVQALDELELEVDRAELLLSAEHARTSGTTVRPAGTVAAGPGTAAGPWVPPQLRTPLPDTLRERAERLLERQLLVTGRLAAAMTSSRRHMDVVERLVPSDPRPMYVDQAL
ncbi:hypothetical protein [Aquipuribacter hungaricus]|uniref:Uncharacterized protein n=2 Tax=Aquipuribacter hungaricus TaxID=545624 RepID=A0ABV7WIN8_9MICO